MSETNGHVPPDKTYAVRAGGNASDRKGKKKLNVLDIILERKSKEVDFNLSKDELGKLLFQKLKLKQENVVKIDTAPYGKIHVELGSMITPEEIMNRPTFDIREGLRTKFYRPHHRKDTLVNISWLDLETGDDLVRHVFSYFGKIKSGIKYLNFKEQEGESAMAKLLNNLPNGERQFWMEVEHPIPSYAVIDGRRVKIWHPGQKRTCARCCLESDKCPGKANAKLCDENGGIKAKTEVVWAETLNKSTISLKKLGT